MKIPTASQNAQTRTTTPADAGRAGEKRDPKALDADAVEGVDVPEGEATSRDFASVLDEVSNAHEGDRREGETQGEHLEAKPNERSLESLFAKRREERKGDDGGDAGRGGGFEQRMPVRETTAAQEQLGARAILHIADLERIVSAVRTQTLAGGVREVTIELRRSVLEGLRVKLNSDGAGRVTAEFLAASERVRSQIDSRAAELADIMRSRGINLAAIRTSVGTSGSDARERGDSASAGGELSRPAPVAQRDAVAPDATASDEALAEDSGTTYRG